MGVRLSVGACHSNGSVSVASLLDVRVVAPASDGTSLTAHPLRPNPLACLYQRTGQRAAIYPAHSVGAGPSAGSRVADVLWRAGASLEARGWGDETPLIAAMRERNWALCEPLIRFYLEKGADPCARSKRGVTPLLLCERLDAATLLMARGARVDAPSLDGVTALHVAAAGEAVQGPSISCEYLAWLLDRGLDPHARMERGETPLHFCGGPATARLLLARGAELEAEDVTGATPLMAAVRRAWSPESSAHELVRFLLDRGARVTARARSGETVLHASGCSATTAMLLQRPGAASLVHARDENGLTPLHCAAERRDDGEMARLLLVRGADPDARTTRGISPLHRCTRRAVADRLLGAGADVNARDVMGYTPLMHYASEKTTAQATLEALELVACLLERGADARAAREDGSTALHDCPDPARAALLLDHGADLEARLHGSNLTPLLDRVKRLSMYCDEARELVRFFVERGADVRARCSEGWTPLHYCDDRDTAELLLDHGADLHARREREEDGPTPLLALLLRMTGMSREILCVLPVHDDRMVETAMLLLERGADPQAFCRGGLTPLHLCVDPAVAERLLSEEAVDVNARTLVHQETPLLLLSQYSCRGRLTGDPLLASVMRLLIERGAEVRARTDEGWTALHWCDDVATARLLLERGAELDAVGHVDASTPLVSLALRAQLYRPSSKELARHLVREGADVNRRCSAGCTLFHYFKDVELMRLLVEHGADPNARVDPAEGDTPLHAVMRRWPDSPSESEWGLLRSLLERGADVAAADARGYTPLHRCKDAEVATMLLDHGADVNALAEGGETPLRVLADRGRLELEIAGQERCLRLAERLLERGADPRLAAEDGRTPLHHCRTRALAEKLLAHGAAIDARDARQCTPLFEAMEREFRAPQSEQVDEVHVELVRFLLCRGASATAVSEWGDSPLHRCWHRDVAQLLLEHGADLEVRDMSARTPLLRVVHYLTFMRFEEPDPRKLELVEWLLERGANPNARDTNGDTPLHVCGTREGAELLLARGADLEARDDAGATPLLRALDRRMFNHKGARDDLEGLLAFLLSRGANPRAKDRFGATALHKPLSPALSALHLDAGAEVDAASVRGDTPLHCTLAQSIRECSSKVEVAQLLLERGANPHAKCWEGRTPLHACDDDKAAVWLLRYGALVDARDFAGKTPLHRLCESGEELPWHLLGLLLERGANPHARNRIDTETPWTLADQRPDLINALSTKYIKVKRAQGGRRVKLKA